MAVAASATPANTNGRRTDLIIGASFVRWRGLAGTPASLGPTGKHSAENDTVSQQLIPFF
jgi:hypothetical protein